MKATRTTVKGSECRKNYLSYKSFSVVYKLVKQDNVI